MPASRTAVIYNPSKTKREDLARAWAGVSAEAEPEWFETTPEDPGQGPARAAIEAGCDLVIAAGGDGTVRAVAEGLAGTDVALGIVPRGTGNLLARNLGVPLLSLPAAMRRALTSESRSMDIGWVDLTRESGTERHAFVVMVGFGLDAQMLAETDDDLKSKAGWLAYVAAMGRALSSSSVIDVRLALDGEPAQSVEAHTLLVGNCGAIQGGVTLFPDAQLDDGLLDVLVMSAAGVGDWLETLRTAMWDNGILRLFDRERSATSTESARHAQAQRLSVELSEPCAFEIDGEEVGEVTGFAVSVEVGALRVR
ncbi:diacylglycerol kinase family lipid kinase [Microbacterium sp. BG28]|uniref:diacylglycerol/lipid kinase family protein n=1 Tax=Microbacterium sp. BG28 TaxID=3097356 RepID=UPI002A59923F|nr:diacylglycerol kinase family lipid kinase [Microbacterium sp. BG28]MDY0827643.1 diacylglycerol kinase family lipid kinase [Microbacterium sp. BG28]